MPLHGTLDVNARPWAKVSVDGRYRGETPQQGIKLAAGTHTVSLSNPELRLSKVLRIKIVAGQRRRVSVRLTR